MKKFIIISIVVLMTGANTALGLSAPSQVIQKRSELNSVNSKIKEAGRKAAEAKKRQALITDKIEESDKALAQIQSQIDTIQSELDTVTEKRRKTETELDIVQAELEDTVDELKKAIKQVKFNRKILNERVANTYKNGKVTYIEVLLNATSFSDFLTRASFLKFIIEQDQQILERMERAKKTVEEQKKQIEDKKQKVESFKADLVAQEQRAATIKRAHEEKRREENSEKLNKQQLFDQAQKDEKEWLAIEDRLEKESRDIEDMLKNLTSGSNSPVMGSGQFVWPVPGRQSGSPFGYRIHPIYKRKKFHAGVDFARSYGTPIYAADDGKVIFAGRRGGYGNTVMVDHGGGLITLYAHCSALYVSEGKMVSKGSRIAAVGSTGLSTGNHLHFEVRVNGTPVNPMKYL